MNLGFGNVQLLSNEKVNIQAFTLGRDFGNSSHLNKS